MRHLVEEYRSDDWINDTDQVGEVRRLPATHGGRTFKASCPQARHDPVGGIHLPRRDMGVPQFVRLRSARHQHVQLGWQDRVVYESAVQRAIQSELDLLAAETRTNKDALEAMLDDDFEEIGASGRQWTKPAIIAELLSSAAPIVEVTEMSARHVNDGVVLVTYVTHGAGRRVRRSSWWRLSDGTWRCFFHQGTVVPSDDQ